MTRLELRAKADIGGLFLFMALAADRLGMSEEGKRQVFGDTFSIPPMTWDMTASFVIGYLAAGVVIPSWMTAEVMKEWIAEFLFGTFPLGDLELAAHYQAWLERRRACQVQSQN